MAIVLLTLIFGIVSLCYIYVKYYYSYWERHNIPYEKPDLLVGNLGPVGKSENLHDFHKRLYKRFKGKAPFAGLFFFNKKVALLLDLELIKLVLIKHFTNFADRGVFNNVRDDPLTGHLFTLESEQWRAMRTKLSPVFTSGKMKFMFETVVNVGENLASACGKLMLQDDVVDLKELCARYATDVIGTCAFGIDCSSLQDPSAEFRAKGRDIMDKPRNNALVHGFISTYPGLARTLRFKNFSDDVSDFFLNAVRQTVDYRLKQQVRRNDFMQMLIDMKAEDEAAARKCNGIDLTQGLTLEQMAAQAFVFFIAGFDTTSSTMSFCLYELALHAEIQEKLHAEIISVLSKHNNELNYECIKEMTYLEQVFSETLRKYPVLPHLQRQAAHDFQVPGTKHIIAAGMNVLIPVAALHYDEELYPDPEKFVPERFDVESVKTRHPCAYLPFGDGPRNCIGLRFGRMQTKIGLILLLKNFKFSTCKATQIPMKYNLRNFLITCESGISLHVERI